MPQVLDPTAGNGRTIPAYQDMMEERECQLQALPSCHSPKTPPPLPPDGASAPAITPHPRPLP